MLEEKKLALDKRQAPTFIDENDPFGNEKEGEEDAKLAMQRDP